VDLHFISVTPDAGNQMLCEIKLRNAEEKSTPNLSKTLGVRVYHAIWL